MNRYALETLRAAGLLVLGAALLGCQAQVAVRPRAVVGGGGLPPSAETVGLWLDGDFTARSERVSSGPMTIDFDLGRGGSPLVAQVVETRFARVLRVAQAPPLPATLQPELAGVLVPRWADFSFQQSDAGELNSKLDARVVLEVSLLARDGAAAWTRSFTGEGSARLRNGEQAFEPQAAAAVNEALESLGSLLSQALADPAFVATLGQVRQAQAAQAQAAALEGARASARRLYVHPFAATPDLAPAAQALQGELVSRLVAAGKALVVASGAQAERLDAAVRGTNREATTGQDWVAIGVARGAEFLLAGDVAQAGSACTVKVELTELASRLTSASYFKSLKVCSPEALLELAPAAAEGIASGF